MRVEHSADLKLISKGSTQIYSAGKIIVCHACRKVSPNKRMYSYRRSSKGAVTLCESCDESAELRSFYDLDGLDFPRKKFRIG